MIIKEVERVAKELCSHTYEKTVSSSGFTAEVHLKVQVGKAPGLFQSLQHRVWSMNQQHQHRLGGWGSGSVSGPTPDLLNLRSFIFPR